MFCRVGPYMCDGKESFNMNNDDNSPDHKKADLPPAAQRALAEAEARRAEAAEREKRQAEKGGPKGPEPTRYGDWERKGRAVDF